MLISHTHMDHTATLPFLIENIFGTHPEPVSIYCAKRVMGAVRRHLFNNDTWPDFTRIPDHVEPSVRFQEIVAEEPFTITGLPSGDLEITAIPVDHIVPTTAFLLSQGSSKIIFTSDTGPTDRIWQVANETPNLKALITECSFPNRMQAVADISLHLTPNTLATELDIAKLFPGGTKPDTTKAGGVKGTYDFSQLIAGGEIEVGDNKGQPKYTSTPSPRKRATWPL